MHLLSDFDLFENDIGEILALSEKIKANPADYGDSMKNKTLIMLFELASLRTRISFEAGMSLLGGHAIFYSVEGGGFTRARSYRERIYEKNVTQIIFVHYFKEPVRARTMNQTHLSFYDNTYQLLSLPLFCHYLHIVCIKHEPPNPNISSYAVDYYSARA